MSCSWRWSPASVMAYSFLRWFLIALLFRLMGSGMAGRGSSEQQASDTTTTTTRPAVVRILAVFDQADVEVMERVSHKTLLALNKEKTAWSAGKFSRLGSFTSRRRPTSSSGQSSLIVESVIQSAQWWKNQTAEDLGRLFLQHRPAAVMCLSVDEHSVFRVALAAAAHHLPVIGVRPQHGLDDSSFQGVSPLYVGLNPGPYHLASALHHLLLANDWLPMTLVVDDSLDAQKIRRAVQLHSSAILGTQHNTSNAHKTSSSDLAKPKVMIVTVNRGSSSRRILAQLSGIQQTESLVIAFCCDPNLASRLYREARRLNMMNGDWVWLALEQATGQHHHDPSSTFDDWPIGLLGLGSQQPLRLTKHTMKGSLAILHSALRASLPVHQLPSWISSWNRNDDTSNSTDPGPLLRHQVSQKLYSEIRWRVKEALAGRLTYDGGGRIDSALRANFDVINLVAPGPFYPSGQPRSRVQQQQPQQQQSSARQRRYFFFGNSSQSESEEDQEPEETSSAVAVLEGDTDGINPMATEPSSVRQQLQHPAAAAAEPKAVWQSVGNVSGQAVTFKGVQWPGGSLAGPRSHSRRVYRVATIFSPPFVMETEVFKEDDEEVEEQRCLTGVPCLRVATSQKDELARIFGDYEAGGLSEDGGRTYNLTCCYGFSIDLMENLASDLDVKFQVYVVADGQCGAKRASKWDGIIADLRSGAAHLSFAPLSVTSGRSEVIDFSIPYFYSGLSILEAVKSQDDVSLLAFFKPFSADLWIGIFVSLNVTAVAVAVYEWLSPFGLNPWGRQRTKNFSLASALWVMWGLLFSHLVAFKAPKSWPNKFLINVWGGFSVIFLASYTANIAALFAGVFSETTVTNFHDPRLLSQKVGTTRSSAADHYAFKTDRKLWEHLQKFTVPTLEEGVARLRDGRLDLLIGDTPILDYYRANDPGCTLRTVDVIEEDNYAVGMAKGLHLQRSISSLISSYSTSGYMDELRSKWYSSLPCARSAHDAYRPQALGVSAVAGVFILLGFGILAGCLILVLEHMVYKYALPGLRRQPKGTIWRSPNMMFFSQKLYRFINCVELLSPHHAAKELMNSLRQGQITSLFQKSVKRKEIEQKRRRKSKAQFFEMIREVRRYQQEEKDIAEERQQSEEEEENNDQGGEDDEEEEDSGAGIYESYLRPLRPMDLPVAVDQTAAVVADVVDTASGSHYHHHHHHSCPTKTTTIGQQTPLRPVLKHSHSTVTDPGTFFDSSSNHPLAGGSCSSNSAVRAIDADKKWRKTIGRRRSFSADALCETSAQPGRRRLGVRFAESSESSASSSESLSHEPEDPTAIGSDEDCTESSILCSMVDEGALHKLTKEDLLLLWQAAEVEWLAKVRALRKQRDILHLRYQHAKSSSLTPTAHSRNKY